MLSVLDNHGNPYNPDFRHFTGQVRQALREYTASAQKTPQGEETPFLLSQGFPFNPPQEASAPFSAFKDTVINPPSSILDLALDTGLLVDDTFTPIRRAAGIYRIVLRLLPIQRNNIQFSLELLNLEEEESSETEEPGNPERKGRRGRSTKAKEHIENTDLQRKVDIAGLYPVSRDRVILDNRMYVVQDLGPLWYWLDAMEQRCSSKELPLFLSIALSRVPDLEVHYEGYTISHGGQRETLRSILFKEVDPYGYLHIQPLHYLQGYSPRFFEDQDIIRLVELDEEFRTLQIFDLIYGPDPVQHFRRILSQFGKQLSTDVYEEQGYFILTPDLANRLISEHIQELIRDFVLLESEVLSTYKVRISHPKLKLHLSSGVDFLSGKADVKLENQEFSYTDFLKQYSTQGFIKLNDESRIYLLPKELDRLQRLLTLRSDKKTKKEEVQVSFFNYPALIALQDLSAEGQAWEQVRDFYSGINRLAESQKAADKVDEYPLAEGALRPYQQYGVRWLEHVTKHNLGACLADDMGLGKTVQVIALLRKQYKEMKLGPSLILMPRSLLYNWEAELRRFAPELRFRIFYGVQRDAEELKDSSVHLVLSTYTTARIDQELFQNIQWEYIILDESQNIKNMENKTSRAILSLKSRNRIALSGTPIENHLGELYSLFAFLNPSFFGSHSEFMQQYMKPIQELKDTDVSRELRLKIYPFILRRMKSEVLKDLPKKNEQTVRIELDQEHLELYHRTRLEELREVQDAFESGDRTKGLFRLLKAMTVLRRLAGLPEVEDAYTRVSAKRDYLLEMIENLAAEGHKCLVFTNFLATVELLSEDLAQRGLANLIMTGSTVDRQGLVRRFQTDENVKVMIMTLKTGGVGLNLTAADYVFIFDPWWNRAAEAQAIDRVHRIGQSKPVFSYRLIAKDTIEERILELQQQKADLVTSILNSDGDLIKSLTPEDINFLLGAS
ncbi:MAG TPA: DEAD/DEAH box helicase [Treponema sp.]|nr:DEAD/DEAH box helicase [Treponema sp.]HRU29562.1 DEAD/DEAH box helicase [Treponema sp.]